jgi:LysR family transcriptional regulator of abg operon
MLKIHHFRDFVAIAEAQSIRGAARELNLAQPYVSRSLKELETELGVALLKRHATGVELTAAGERFLIRSRTALGEFQKGREEMKNWGKEIGGRVYIALSSPPILALLPEVYKTFRRLCPNVHMQLTETTFPAAEPLLRDGRADFYVGGLMEQTVHRSFERTLLFHNRRLIVARHNHPLHHAKTLKDLQHADWIYGGLTHRAEQDLEELFSRHGLDRPAQLTRVDSQMCMLMLMLNSDAIAMVPQQWASARVINELIQPIQLDNDFPSADVVMVTRSGVPLTPPAEKLANLFIREAQALYGPADSTLA